jgi:hypothetical protein
MSGRWRISERVMRDRNLIYPDKIARWIAAFSRGAVTILNDDTPRKRERFLVGDGTKYSGEVLMEAIQAIVMIVVAFAALVGTLFVALVAGLAGVDRARVAQMRHSTIDLHR